jgi:hypothetical protein
MRIYENARPKDLKYLHPSAKGDIEGKTAVCDARQGN